MQCVVINAEDIHAPPMEREGLLLIGLEWDLMEPTDRGVYRWLNAYPRVSTAGGQVPDRSWRALCRRAGPRVPVVLEDPEYVYAEASPVEEVPQSRVAGYAVECAGSYMGTRIERGFVWVVPNGDTEAARQLQAEVERVRGFSFRGRMFLYPRLRYDDAFGSAQLEYFSFCPNRLEVLTQKGERLQRMASRCGLAVSVSVGGYRHDSTLPVMELRMPMSQLEHVIAVLRRASENRGGGGV